MSWQPSVGQKVWLNYPDGRFLGEVVGYVDAVEQPRDGQPIIEQLEDEEPPFPRKKGDRFIVHPDFLLPMPYGSPEHREAMEGTSSVAQTQPPTISV